MNISSRKQGLTQGEKAREFRRLHANNELLILPNAWDAASARGFEEAGAAAIATTSAGVAWSLGHPDGESLDRHEAANAVGRIARAVDVPVTADIEGGYGCDCSEVALTTKAVVRAGAVGINLEDGTTDPDEPLRELSAQTERIQAALEAASSVGVGVVLNARTDTYWLGVGEGSERFELTLQRAEAYQRAGAKCLFVPGLSDPRTIDRLAREVDVPLNVLAGPGVPPVAELQRLGVGRLSVGSGPTRASLALVRRIATELLQSGTYDTFATDAVPYSEVDGAMRAHAS